MPNRLRKVRLSLAAKCELLFGAAVVLVIAAAVFLPWLRMEELTVRLNERTARGLIQSELDNHVALQELRTPATRPADGGAATRSTDGVGPAALPTAEPQIATSRPASQPASQPAAGVRFQPVHMSLLAAYGAEANLTEQRTVREVDRHPSTDYYSRLYREDSGTYRYRYGRYLFLDTSCQRCHEPAPSDAGPPGYDIPKTAFGIASVDIPSQVEPTELLLNRVFIFTAALIAGTLALLVFYLIISRLILQPVRALQVTAEKVSKGDLNIRTHIPTNDEFQLLSETFNEMLQNLKEGEDQLRAMNKSLDLKLEQMTETNLALYETNRLKTEFLANVSHELRTPLNSILGFAEILRDNASVSTDAKNVRYLQNIVESGKHLLDLINDLLDLAKIEAGRMEVRSEPLSLSDLFEGLSSILKPLLEPRSLSVDVEVGSDVPLLHTDAAKLQQVLYNFLSNAIKFSPVGGRIGLAAQRQEAERVRIAVTDHGPGISLEKQSLIFEKFRQVDASHTREHGGTGLGLAISRDLVRLLGGEIGVKSEPGDGATFWVVIPLAIQSTTMDMRQGPKVVSSAAPSAAV